MLTIFTIPRAFQGHAGIIQTNAIKSWCELPWAPEIILFGNDAGVSETASQINAKHIPDIECNSHGTPLIASAFEIAQRIARYPTLCYVNADIILFRDLIDAILKIYRRKFLMVGQRIDTDIDNEIDFSNPNWESELQELASNKGVLHPRSGIDYFVFTKGMYNNIPPFAIGRYAWDNWLIYEARRTKAPVIDATRFITAIHQNHNQKNESRKRSEITLNRQLLGGIDNAFGLDYANFFLTEHGVKRALSIRSIYFQIRTIALLHLRFALPLFRLVECLRKGLIVVNNLIPM